AAELKAKGAPLPKRRGRRGWINEAVYCILTNPHYTGDLFWNRTSHGKHHKVQGLRVCERRHSKTASGRVKVVRNPEGEVIVVRAAHPAIVDRETFELVRAKLAANSKSSGRKRGSPDWPFSGLVVCGDCGSRMYGMSVVKRSGDKVYEWRKY